MLQLEIAEEKLENIFRNRFFKQLYELISKNDESKQQ